MKRFIYTFTFNHFYIYVIALILCVISIIYPICFIIFIFIVYKYKSKINFYILFIIILLYSLSFYLYTPKEENISNNVVILEKESFDTYSKYVILNFPYKYHLTSRQSFNIGDIINVQGNILKYKKNTIPNGFDSYTYNLGKHIQGQVKIESIKLLYESKLPKIDSKVPLMSLFKDHNMFEDYFFSFLFKLNSLHLSVIILLIFKLLYYLDIENQNKYLITSLIMIFIYFIGYSILVFRLFIKYILKYIDSRLELELSNFELEMFTLFLILIFLPLSIYNQSFIVVYCIVILNYLKVLKTPLINNILTPLILIPFLSIWYYEINILSIILIPIITLLVKYIYVPSLILVTLLPFLGLIGYMDKLFYFMDVFLSHYSINIPIYPINGFLLIVYFLLIIYTLKSIKINLLLKRLVIVLSFILILVLYTSKPLEDKVVFLDVGQGDSAVIFKNNHVIVVDAFGPVDKYLKSKYIDTIDYLILTHPDYDHIKNAEVLMDKFKVKNLVLNKYDEYPHFYVNKILVGSNNLLKIDELDLYFIGPLRNYNNKNDNSLVFKISVNHKEYLFTGDIGVGAEVDLVKTYKSKLQSQILKVSHHGSITSSSYIFLETILPEMAIISVGSNSIYGLPDDLVIQRINQLGITIYNTNLHGSVIIKNKTIETYPP
ncbi:ComEC/Rec2 family competence protein [Acholeplasma granularum]|uniref:ComEC/Rec2 family competence protein n=1 Tax=Acholeplasma granularum TaxID=264635 RepID=UPI00047191AB|nr:MBL fold metallo-hydrolase [Acholeplasma granularum]